MNHPHAALGILLLSATLGCEGVSRAPAGSPRLELGVTVRVDDSYRGKLQGAGQELAQAVTDAVMARADIGLRFYPVLMSDYGDNDAYPDYRLNVVVRDLDVKIDHRTIPQKDADPVVEVFAKRIDCAVESTLVKDRVASSRGPDLTVGASTQKGSAAAKPVDEESEVTSYVVLREGNDLQPVTVGQPDLMRAVDQALVRSLRDLVTPISREEAFRK